MIYLWLRGSESFVVGSFARAGNGIKTWAEQELQAEFPEPKSAVVASSKLLLKKLKVAIGPMHEDSGPTVAHLGDPGEQGQVVCMHVLLNLGKLSDLLPPRGSMQARSGRVG